MNPAVFIATLTVNLTMLNTDHPSRHFLQIILAHSPRATKHLVAGNVNPNP